MPSVKNPNRPSRNRLAARAAKVRKQQRQKHEAAKTTKGGVEKSDVKRGARPGLLPTSGPRAPISSKKQRKLERKMGYALKRKMEAEGEVVMKDVPTTEGLKQDSKTKGEEEQMEMDIS